MICIYCGNKTTEVTNSRARKQSSGVWRRRRCTVCAQDFTTDETPRSIIKVAHGNSTAAAIPLSSSKLTISIWKSFQHDPHLGSLVAGDLALTVIAKVTPSTSVTPAEIAQVAYQTIRRYDESAGLTYALQHRLLTSVKRRGRPSLVSPDAFRDEPVAGKPMSPYQSHQTYRDTFRAPDESAH